MSKRKHRLDNLAGVLQEYASSRKIELFVFSPIHTRMTDGLTVIDIWPTTGKYWVKETDYHSMTDKMIVERAGETGLIPFGTPQIFGYLDKIFFAPDM